MPQVPEQLLLKTEKIGQTLRSFDKMITSSKTRCMHYKKKVLSVSFWGLALEVCVSGRVLGRPLV